MRGATLPIVLFLALQIGCSQRGESVSPPRDTGPTTVDAGSTPKDAGSTLVDAGSTKDAGAVEVPSDAGFVTLPTARAAEGGAFATSQSCATCHAASSGAQAMRDDAGRNIAPFDLWQSSMMANAARDPLFRAVVSAEVAATPSAKAAIETKCLGCHTPMASRVSKVRLDTFYENTPLAQLGLDGVSCTVCHQIEPEGLGTSESFSGHFTVGEDRVIYGPHENPFAMPMINHSGYVPQKQDHILDAALCGSCHTLYTNALDPDGRPNGARLPEQTPFLEWRNSSFPEAGETCQSCHAPTTDVDGAPIATRIARNPGGRDFPPVDDRSPYGRHVFVGANTLVPALLRDNASLGAPAPAAAFDATIAAARDQLRRSALLSVTLTRSDDEMRADVRIENRTGHKLPTAHPTRRMWLHVRIEDNTGRVVLDSGAHDEAMRIVGADGPLPFEAADGSVAAHVDVITRSDQAAVYEAIMGDTAGTPTTLLSRGARFIKDNRILPRGWSVDGPYADDTAPRGVADDSNFGPGSDTVRYVANAPRSAGPYRVTAALRYVTLSPRWYAELIRYNTPEIASFRQMYEQRKVEAETIAEVIETE